jgi:hypothetical protein
MAGTWTTERFPAFENAVHQLAEQHRELEDEPLHLALSYEPQRDSQDVFLFEIIGGNSGPAGSDGDLFEVTFAPNADLPLPPNELLHLILSNPPELDLAMRQGWQRLREILLALRSGEYRVLHSDTVGSELLQRLIQAANNMEDAARG